ncbi:hypothetical protein ZOSMA_26G00680 [Zostera marina]|uniref:Uncharacterized protein n=1 Tax=Zostera marina TaxID=29655 RepID=A0A0K9PED1_ZOSMR|nr:hypothetical protein ZOSMA_26G00680 [Zostera marina]
MSRIVVGNGVDLALVLLRYDLRNKRFEDRTLRILETVLVAKDVKSLVDARSASQEVLRSEVVPIMGEITGRDIDEKLRVAEFFVKAFALVGDIESFMAIKYEVLILRELKHMSNPCLQVLYEEWISFALESFNYGFYSIAIKGFDNALLCIHSSNRNINLQAPLKTEEIIKKIKKHRDRALALTSSHSGTYMIY